MQQIIFKQLLVLLFACVLQTAVAQHECSFILSGNISDADTREPLAYATIELQGKYKHVTADSNGKYVITGLCSGDYVLIISHFSCTPVFYRVKVTQNTVQNIVLPHKVNELSEVRIVEKYDTKPAAIIQQIGIDELRLKSGLSLAEQLQSVSGVSMLQTGNNIAKPVVNGLLGNRLQLISNGVRLESQQWGNDHAPEIDPFTAYQITVIKGAGALRYGSDALAGAIVLEPKALPVNGRMHAEFQTGYFHNNHMGFINAMVEKNLKSIPALSWRFQLSQKTGGNIRTPDYYLWNSGVREWNGSATIGWRKPNYRVDAYASVYSSTLGIFLGSQVGNTTDLTAAIQRQTPLFNLDEFSYSIERPRQDLMHLTGKIKHVYYKDSRHTLHTQFSYQRNHRKEYDLAMITQRPELDLVLNTAQADVWYEHKHDNWMHTYGTANTLQEQVWDGSRFFVPNYRSVSTAGYYLARYHQHKHDLELGVRYDYRNLTTFRNNKNGRTSDERNWNNFSGTVNYQRSINPNFKYALNTGIAWRPPSINELFVNGLHHGTSSFEIGNAQLRNEVGYKAGFRFNINWLDSLLQIDAYFYNQLFDGFINLVPDTPATLTIRGAYPTFRFVQTTANLSGYDLRFTLRPIGLMQIQSVYSVVYAYDISQQSWLAQMPGNRLLNEILLKVPDYKLLHATQWSIALNSVFRQQRIPISNTDYALPPDTYHLLNTAFTTHIKNCMIQVGVNNLMNIRYREYLNRFRYFNDEPGRNIYVKLGYNL